MGLCSKSNVFSETKLQPLVIPTRDTENSFESSISTPNITDVYVLKKVIGKGSFGTVRRGNRLDNPAIQIAVKSIPKSLISFDLLNFKNEFSILSLIDHPNIVRLYDSFEDPYFFHIVTEFCLGGELFDRILSKGRLTEKSASLYMQKMLRAVSHLHENGISHRDIKPQNFVFYDETEEAELKLIDFGLSKKHNPKVRMNSFVGTPLYIAPEVLKGSYSEKCDIWGLGVILSLMLTGTFPFEGSSTNDIYRNLLKNELNTESYVYKHLSDPAIDLLRKLLEKNPERRISAKEALAHPWIKLKFELKINENIYRDICLYRPTSELYKMCLGIIVKYMSSEELASLNQAFNEADIEGNGYLTYENMQNALKISGLYLPKHELSSLLQRLDSTNSGIIHYSNFLSAAISNRLSLDEQMLSTLFNFFDTYKTGELTPRTLRRFFKKLGIFYPSEKISKLINEVSGTNSISFEDFKRIFKFN